MDAIILWLDKMPLDRALKIGFLLMGSSVAAYYIALAALTIVRIRKGVKADGDLYIIK